jgi:hypothetical protein
VANHFLPPTIRRQPGIAPRGAKWSRKKNGFNLKRSDSKTNNRA